MWYELGTERYVPERAANFIERVIFKQVSSLSAESLVHLWNAYPMIMLRIYLSVFIIISLSIYIYDLLQKHPPEPKNTEWKGVWRNLGETLEKWASLVSWNFIPEHLQDPENLSSNLRQRCCSSGRYEEAQIIRGLTDAYRALFITIPERERESLKLSERVSEIERESLQAERESFQESSSQEGESPGPERKSPS